MWKYSIIQPIKSLPEEVWAGINRGLYIGDAAHTRLALLALSMHNIDYNRVYNSSEYCTIINRVIIACNKFDIMIPEELEQRWLQYFEHQLTILPPEGRLTNEIYDIIQTITGGH